MIVVVELIDVGVDSVITVVSCSVVIVVCIGFVDVKVGDVDAIGPFELVECIIS